MLPDQGPATTDDSCYCIGTSCNGDARLGDDPCQCLVKPTPTPLAPNSLLEHYGNLNFDPTPWGYKVLGVSYGGTLQPVRLQGREAAADADGARIAAGEDEHCVVPSPTQSTLDTAEMQAWANLSGSSWARLQAT